MEIVRNNFAHASFSEQLLKVIEKLSRITLVELDMGLVLQDCAEIIHVYFEDGICSIELIRNENYIEQVACAGCIESGKQSFSGRRSGLRERGATGPLDRKFVNEGLIIEKYGLQEDGQGVIQPSIARLFGVQSLLSHPLISQMGLLGYLNYYSAQNNPFTAEKKQSLRLFAQHLSMTIDHLESRYNHRRLARLNEAMQQMTMARNTEELFSLIFKSAIELVHAPYAAICRLNMVTGELAFIAKSPDLSIRKLQPGKGISNEALRRGEPIIVDDVHTPEWEHVYVEGWPGSVAEMAVPITLSNAAVRIGVNVERATKTIGVINLESPKAAAFSKEDAELIWSLASYGAELIEGLETYMKQSQVAELQRAILDKSDWDGTIQVMLKVIKDTLGYDYANISHVRPNTNDIKTANLVGISSEDEVEFKRIAVHSLDSDDIQASIVRSRQIEVPAQDDPRFDRKIYNRFHHQEMIRVFIPMIAPTDKRVIGTVEAGYRRSEHRKHIYEQDIQILKGFIDDAAGGLERRQDWVLEKIGHEFRSSVVGIRNNASFLQRRHDQLETHIIERKCDDILTDCEILLSQIAQLERFLGIPLRSKKIERVLVYRDVIMKTIRQLTPIIRGQGYDPKRVDANEVEFYKILPIWADKGWLSQVFFNLLTNSIKYSESDPSTFKIIFKVDQTNDFWLIKVQDWGIGVLPDYKETIFEVGFRTPQALTRNVTGSGLGCTIARQYMQEMEGDLLLTQYYKPTEFTVKLPKSLARKPKEE